jgi:integrase
MAVEASQVRAGESVQGKDIRFALDAFLFRADVKSSTHGLNRRHLESLVQHFKLRRVDQLTETLIHQWSTHLKATGHNAGGQSLCLRILRSFCRLCRKRKWLTNYPFEDFRMPKSEFVGSYLTEEARAKLLSINPRYDVDIHLNRVLTFGLYSLLRISQVFHADWSHFKAPDQLWIPGIKGQDGRWITLHPKAVATTGVVKEQGPIFDRWTSLPAFREAVYKKAKRERLPGVRFHETKHTGISALLEAGYSIPEVWRISGNSYRTIAHYAHVDEKKVFEEWKGFDYCGRSAASKNCTATVQQEVAKQGSKEAPGVAREQQGENAEQRQFATNSSH